MKIYLCDRTYNSLQPGRCDWFVHLQRGFGDLFRTDETQGIDTVPDDHVAYGCNDAVLFVHSTETDDWENKVQEHHIHCHIVLVRSGGGQRSTISQRGKLHACFWSPAHFSAAAVSSEPDRLARWIRQVKSGDVASLQWNLLQPEPTERLWALRLLCEASELPETKNTIPKDWISLLKEKESETSRDVKSVIEANIDELGIEISKEERAAIDSLLKIVENGQRPNDAAADTVTACGRALGKLLEIPAENQQNRAV